MAVKTFILSFPHLCWILTSKLFSTKFSVFGKAAVSWDSSLVDPLSLIPVLYECYCNRECDSLDPETFSYWSKSYFPYASDLSLSKTPPFIISSNAVMKTLKHQHWYFSDCNSMHLNQRLSEYCRVIAYILPLTQFEPLCSRKLL